MAHDSFQYFISQMLLGINAVTDETLEVAVTQISNKLQE